LIVGGFKMRIIYRNTIAIGILLLVIALLGSCSDGVRSENTAGRDTDTPAPEPQKLEREIGLIHDEQTQIHIPNGYETFDMLMDIDDDYYYLQDTVDLEYWKWIAIDKNTGEVIEYAPIDISLDGKFTLGYQGDLYTSTMEWKTDLDCRFKILKLGKDGSVSTCFELNTLGYPRAMPYNDYHVVLDYCTKTKGKLFDLNLLTGEETVIMEYDVTEAANGHLYGTRISGLDYSTELPSDKGFCYAVDELALVENSVEPYTYEIYYYSFENKKSSHIDTLIGDEVGYIGGDMKAYIPRLSIDGIKQEGTGAGVDILIKEGGETDDAVSIYINENGNYVRYIVPLESETSNLDIRGSGVIGNGDYIAYGDGFYYFDTKTKKYDRIKYFVGGTEGMDYKNQDIYDVVWGNIFDGSAFYFTSKDTEGALTLHKITRAA
jgi:hypothetical protein